MLVEQVNQKNVKFVIISTLKILVLNMNQVFEMVVMVYCKKLLVYVKESAYRINFWYMNKDDAINMMNNSSLIDKIRVL